MSLVNMRDIGASLIWVQEGNFEFLDDIGVYLCCLGDG